MISYGEINKLFKNFDSNSYNRKQIGSDKQLVITIYEFLNKLNIAKDILNILIDSIAYLNKDSINIPLFLELLSKSLGFVNEYTIHEVLEAVQDVHDTYFRDDLNINLEEYLHDTSENRMRKLFLDRNGKYLEKDFNSERYIIYISDLKLMAAICLDSKEYNEFIGYIEDFKTYQLSYSPLLIFKTYTKLRKNLKGMSRLFWDLLFGNEYLISLYKCNINLSDIYKENIYSLEDPSNINTSYLVQLDLFSYQKEEEKIRINETVKSFQICTIIN